MSREVSVLFVSGNQDDTPLKEAIVLAIGEGCDVTDVTPIKALAPGLSGFHLLVVVLSGSDESAKQTQMSLLLRHHLDCPICCISREGFGNTLTSALQKFASGRPLFLLTIAEEWGAPLAGMIRAALQAEAVPV